jgi:hypothetical protein
LKIKGRAPTITTKSSKNDVQDLCNKSYKGVMPIVNNRYNKNMVVPIVRDIHKKSSTTKINTTNELVLSSNANNFNIGGSTQIYVNQLVLDNKNPAMNDSTISLNDNTKKRSTVAFKVSTEDRKFSIMDIPCSVVNIHSKIY